MKPEEDAACTASIRALVALPRAMDVELIRSTGLSLTEYSVLAALADEPGRASKTSALAELTDLSVGGLSRLIDRFIPPGLVERKQSAEDRRVHLVVLTEAGLELFRNSKPAYEGVMRRLVLDNLMGLAVSDLSQRLPATSTRRAVDQPDP